MLHNLGLVLYLVARCYNSPAEKLENHYNSTAKTQNSDSPCSSRTVADELTDHYAQESAKRSAKRSLVTFFGFGKKVTRLSAGTDGLDLYDYAKKS